MEMLNKSYLVLYPMKK